MAASNVQARLNSDLKVQAEALFSELGLYIPTAIRLFLHQAILANGLPFAAVRAPFCGTVNQFSLPVQCRICVKARASLTR